MSTTDEAYEKATALLIKAQADAWEQLRKRHESQSQAEAAQAAAQTTTT